MYKFIKILCLTCVFALTAFAQNQQSRQQTDDYRKNEYYLGYSNQQTDSGGYRSANGFQGSYVRNIKRYMGIKADFSAAFDKETFDYTTIDPTTPGNPTYTVRQRSNNSTYNILGGVQFKNNASNARFKPFGHALAGVAILRSKFNATCTSAYCPPFVTNYPNFTYTSRNLAFAVGGGLDIKINDKIDVRAIQVDFNPIWRGGGFWQKNIRIGAGIVF